MQVGPNVSIKVEPNQVVKRTSALHASVLREFFALELGSALQRDLDRANLCRAFWEIEGAEF